MTSPDGSTWTARVVGSDVNINSIAFAQDIFVAGTGNANYLTAPMGALGLHAPFPRKILFRCMGEKIFSLP